MKFRLLWRTSDARPARADAAGMVQPNVLGGMLVLALFQMLGEVLASLARLPLPGAIVGLLLLLPYLALRGGPHVSIDAAARLLLKYLPLFLVPVCVGLMQIVPPNSHLIPKLLLTLALASAFAVAFTSVFIRMLLDIQAKIGRRSPAAPTSETD